MFYYLVYFTPFIAAAAAYFTGANAEYWWAYLLIATAVSGIMHLLYRQLSMTKEYLSGYVTKAIHINAWIERVVTVETRQVNGRTVHTQRVSYVNHPDRYMWELNTGHEVEVGLQSFRDMISLWSNPVEFYPVAHINCVSGGNGEICHWNGDEWKTPTVTYTHRYRNPVRYSNSIFHDNYISKKDARKLDLIDYPEIKGHEQEVILCQPGLDIDPELLPQNYIQHINAFCGHENQIHVFILLFSASEGIDISFKQRSYWKGLNKNELVICLGMDGTDIKWCQPLSWMDEPTMAVWIQSWFLEHDSLNIPEFYNALRENIGQWHRKQFSDFKYLGHHLSRYHAIAFGSLVTLLAAATYFICISIK